MERNAPIRRGFRDNLGTAVDDFPLNMLTVVSDATMANYSTSQAAKKCGIHHITLQRWISEGKITGPKKTRVGGVIVRLWTDADLKRVRNHKKERYRKGRGRKPKLKR